MLMKGTSLNNSLTVCKDGVGSAASQMTCTAIVTVSPGLNPAPPSAGPCACKRRGPCDAHCIVNTSRDDATSALSSDDASERWECEVGAAWQQRAKG